MAASAVAVTAIVSVATFTRGGTSPDERITIEGAAPAFDLPRVGAPDEPVTLAAFAGKPLVINFWASWCVPCRKEMPALQRASERLAGRVVFVGINHQDIAADAAEFERNVGVTYPSGHDPGGDVARAYGVLGLPTTVFVDQSGRIVARRPGEITDEKLDRLLVAAFDVPPSADAP